MGFLYCPRNHNAQISISNLSVTSLVPPKVFRAVLAARVTLFLIFVESIAWIAFKVYQDFPTFDLIV